MTQTMDLRETFGAIQPDRVRQNKPSLKTLEQDIAAVIGRNLRLRRRALVLSQAQSARTMRVSPSSYKRMESGHVQPRLYNAVMWSLNTGVPTSWLFHGSGVYALAEEPVVDPRWQPLVSFLSCANQEALHCLQTLAPHILDQLFPPLDPVNLGELPSLPSASAYYSQLMLQLRQWRETSGLSQCEAAARFELGESSYRRYECPNKTTRINLALMMRFHKVTGIDPLELSINTELYPYRQRQRRMLATITPYLTQFTQADQEAIMATIGHLHRHLRCYRDK